MALLIWNVALVICVATLYSTGLEFGTTLNGLDTSDIAQFLAHLKSTYISQLIKGKSWDLQTLIKYSDGTANSAFNLFVLFGVLPISFVLYLKDLLAAVLLRFILLPLSSVSFSSSFISSLK